VTTNVPTEPTASASLPTLGECWQRMPHKGAFGGLLLAWLALFHFLGNSTFGYTDTPSLFGWLKYCYSMKGEEEHVFIVPFVVLFLLWWKRDVLLEVHKRFSSMALLLLAAAVVLHAAGYVVQQARLSFLGFILGLFALMGVVWGPKWLRAILFPFFLLVFCMPLGPAGEIITFPLRLIVTKLSVAISQYGLGIDVIRNGTQIFDSSRTFQYDVAPACSGIRSLVALLAMATIYGVIGFSKTWKTILIVCSAVPLAVLGNTARLTTVILVGKMAGQEAGMRVEQNLGFVTFVVSIAGMLLIGYFIRDRKDKSPHPEPLATMTAQPAEQVSS
jgi:exosortase